MNKKGYFFIVDALIGVAIMIAALTYFYNIQSYEQPKDQMYLLADNLISFMSQIRIAGINNQYVNNLRINKNITNEDNTILEQINEFEYLAKNGCSICENHSKNMIANITNGIIESQYNFKLSLNNKTIYEQSKFDESRSLTSIKLGRVIYTIINGTSLYGPSYAEISVWQ